MSSTTITDFKQYSAYNLTTNAKLALSYLAAHFTAIATVGSLFLLGIFDVGFLSEQSLVVQLVNYLIS